ncbi:MAG: hypothetical protein ACRDRK_03770 [Pseudonocardia sp.]
MSVSHGGFPPLPAGDDPIAVVVAFIVVRPGLIENMLREHARDDSGQCRRCRFHLRPERWPCFDARMALTARDFVKRAREHEQDLSGNDEFGEHEPRQETDRS